MDRWTPERELVVAVASQLRAARRHELVVDRARSLEVRYLLDNRDPVAALGVLLDLLHVRVTLRPYESALLRYFSGPPGSAAPLWVVPRRRRG